MREVKLVVFDLAGTVIEIKNWCGGGELVQLTGGSTSHHTIRCRQGLVTSILDWNRGAISPISRVPI